MFNGILKWLQSYRFDGLFLFQVLGFYMFAAYLVCFYIWLDYDKWCYWYGFAHWWCFINFSFSLILIIYARYNGMSILYGLLGILALIGLYYIHMYWCSIGPQNVAHYFYVHIGLTFFAGIFYDVYFTSIIGAFIYGIPPQDWLFEFDF